MVCKRFDFPSLLVFISLVLGAGTGRETKAKDALGKPESRSNWGTYVQDFRRNHHFALTFAATSGVWKYHTAQFDGNKVYPSKGLGTKFEYSFRMPLRGKFGYLLGSSLGANYEDTEASPEFQVGSVWRLPGLLVGGVCNINPYTVVVLTYESYLERVENLLAGSLDEQRGLSTTMRANYDFGAALEVYQQLFWGMRVEIHQRKIVYVSPKGSLDKAENVAMAKADQWLGFGVVYHLL